MERLSALDAEFLHVEDDVAHMHIAGACVFADPPPSFADLHRLLTAKLHLIPRYRQRVRTVPLELGRPVWCDDPHFDLDYHLRHSALPTPGDDAAFCRLMGRLMSQPLDRDRPLWETWLVEGLEGGRWALVFKVHHCLVDGISGVGLLGVLLDADADTPLPAPQPWEPSSEPGGAAKVLNAWTGLVGDALSTASSVTRAVVHPATAVRATIGTARGLARFARQLGATPHISIQGAIGPHRAWAHSDASLDDVRAIRTAFGGTINDVVLAAVGGGYRDLLLTRGGDPNHAVVRAAVPVSTRHHDALGVPDNRVSTLLYDLPVHVSDPLERLRLVTTEMTDLKASHEAEAGEAIVTLADLLPPMVVGPISRLVMRTLHRLPQRAVNTIVTNVPGPQFPLFCLGRQMLEYRPFVPITHGIRVSTAILSYDGRLYFGITGDGATAPDIDVIAQSTTTAIERLAGMAHTVNERQRSTIHPIAG